MAFVCGCALKPSFIHSFPHSYTQSDYSYQVTYADTSPAPSHLSEPPEIGERKQERKKEIYAITQLTETHIFTDRILLFIYSEINSNHKNTATTSTFIPPKILPYTPHLRCSLAPIPPCLFG